MAHEFRPQRHPGRPRLIVPARTDPEGRLGPTRAQARTSAWRRSSHGYYLPANVERSVDQRILEAAMVLPAYGGVTGWAALRWLGGSWFDGLAPDARTERPVVLATGIADVRAQAGIQVTAERILHEGATSHDGIRVTPAVKSVLFEMRYATDLREAVVALDMAARDDLVSIAEAAAHARQLPAFTGIPQARAALQLADENSWSPWETRLRLCWVLDAGLAPPLCNVPLFDRAGNHLGTPDLFEPVAGLVGEYDGGLHLAGHQRRKDLAREARFREHGLEYVAIVGGDLWHTDRVAERLRAAADRSRWLPEGRRTWTLRGRSGRHPARSVEQRRADRAAQDVRWT